MNGPLWLLAIGGTHPQCGECGNPLRERFCGVVFEDADGEDHPRQMLVFVCSSMCQQIHMAEQRDQGIGCEAWAPNRVRAALDRTEMFEQVIDFSLANFERVLTEATLQ